MSFAKLKGEEEVFTFQADTLSTLVAVQDAKIAAERTRSRISS